MVFKVKEQDTQFCGLYYIHCIREMALYSWLVSSAELTLIYIALCYKYACPANSVIRSFLYLDTDTRYRMVSGGRALFLNPHCGFYEFVAALFNDIL